MQKKPGFYFGLFMLYLTLFIGNSAQANDWRFPVGLTAMTGYSDVVDLHEDNLEAQGYSVDTSTYWPVGVSFQPYLLLDNGMTVGGGLGPLAFIIMDKSSRRGDDEDADFYDVPINGCIGYTFLPTQDISPYVKGGLMYHIAGGGYVESVTPGLFGAVGVEFLRKRMVGVGLEISYDTSKIEFEKFTYSDGRVRRSEKEIEPYKLMISVSAIF